MMEGLTCTVVWKVEDPGLTGLLGPPPEQGGMWYVLRPTVADVPLQVCDKGSLLPCLKRPRQLLLFSSCLG